MMLKEVLQKKFEYGELFNTKEYIYFHDYSFTDITVIKKVRFENLEIVGEICLDCREFTYETNGDYLLLEDNERNRAFLYFLPNLKKVHSYTYEYRATDIYDYEDFLFVVSEKNVLRFCKENWNCVKVANLNDWIEFCLKKGNTFVCKDFYNLYIYEMKDDKMNVILQVKMDSLFPEDEIKRLLLPTYKSSNMRLYRAEFYGNDLIVLANVGFVRMTIDGKVVWKTICHALRSDIIGRYGYVCFNSVFYRIDLDNGELYLYGNKGELPTLTIDGHEMWPSGKNVIAHNELLWRMLYDCGLTLLAAIDPETGQFKYFHRFYDIAYENCRPEFINGKIYLYDAITKTLHVLEEVEGEPEKTFCGVPMSETELEKVDITKKVNNKKPAPTYEDGDIPLFEEIKQVAHIEHACVLDAECIDSLEDYSSLIVDILSLADVRKFTIVEHTLSGSISLKKGRKEVEFTPDGSDYIDSDAMLKALNEFLPICGAKGKIFSLWTPDMLQTEMFFYTEDTEAVEKYSAENLQTDEAVDFEDMKGEIKW